MRATYKRKSKSASIFPNRSGLSSRVAASRRQSWLESKVRTGTRWSSKPHQGLETYRGETKRVHSVHEGATDPFEKAEKMNASVALFHFPVSGIPETGKFSLIGLKNVRLCQFRSSGQGHQPWPISNQEY